MTFDAAIDASLPQKKSWALEGLRPLSRKHKPKPKRILTIDIESKDGGSQRAGFTRPFLTGLYDGRMVRQWRNAPHLAKLPWQERHLAHGGCIDAMMRALLVPDYYGAHCYAHNGGAFDFLFCVAWLAKSKKYKWSLTPQGPNILALRIEMTEAAVKKENAARRKRQKRGRLRPSDEGYLEAPDKLHRRKKAVWTLVDSVRLLPMSLAEAARAFGAPVQKKKFALHTPEKDPAWEAYHADDLRSLYGSLLAVERMLGRLGGEMALTAPSAALKLFQRKFLSQPLERNKHEPGCDKDGGEDEGVRRETCAGCAHAFVRKAYKGGRVEVFRLQGKELRYYDINSSYPAAMQWPMPAGPMVVHRDMTPSALEHYFDGVRQGDWVGFAACRVSIPVDCEIPPLPWHEPDTGKLLFPVGTFEGVWDLSELELAIKVGGEIASIDKMYLYPGEPIFRAMIEELYPLRDKRSPSYEEGMGKLVKLLLNALYGKFGQRPERTEVVYLPSHRTAAPPLGGVPAGGDAFNTPIWYVPIEKDQAHILPHIAAHVTSLARVRLWHAMNAVLARGGRIYYLDTDSVVCDVELPSSNNLGKLKREFPCPNLSGEFVRPKVYRVWCACTDKAACEWYQDTCKKKGKKAKAMRGQKIVCKGVPARVLDPTIFQRYLHGEKVKFKRLAKLRTMAKEDLISPWMVPSHKRMVTAYDKRILQADGISTKPIVLVNNEMPT